MSNVKKENEMEKLSSKGIRSKIGESKEAPLWGGQVDDPTLENSKGISLFIRYMDYFFHCQSILDETSCYLIKMDSYYNNLVT